VDEEVRRIVQEAFDRAYNVLLQNKTRLIMISERLIREETLEGPLFEALFNQPIEGEQYESPSILAGMPNMPRTQPTNLDEDAALFSETGTPIPLPPQLQSPYNGNGQ
jgi:cell division protease FtsH